MTQEKTGSAHRENLRPPVGVRFLPWMIAAGTFLIYIITLSHWVTFRSLPVVAKVAGWDWRVETTTPIHFLATLPLYLFSGNAQIIALNLFSALCAAFTLALLARSIQLLPHDRTRDQRQRELGKFALLNLPHAWLAPVAGVLVCGLQLTFWEHAIASTGEIFDLLLFAYVIRCLLEFRVSKQEPWIAKFALAYGLAITNNWAMIGFFPFFLVGLIWIKGLSFFQFRFISRVAAFGAIGLSFYFLLPALSALSSSSDLSFYQALKENLRFQKYYLYAVPFVQFPAIRARLLMIALTSLLPLLMIAIRWPSFRGDISPAGTSATTFMFRLMHIVFLGIGLWIFFDPQFSARALGYDVAPYLTFYFLTALGVGYFVGYVLLVFGRQPMQAWERSRGALKIIDPVVVIAAWIAALAVPVALAVKNFPMIRAGNGDDANQFFKTVSESLPASGALVLSDDAARLHFLRAIDAQLGRASSNILVDTAALNSRAYHRKLHAHYPSDWPEQGETNQITDYGLLQRIDVLSKTHRVFYLHPSFGYYFERYYPTSHKLVYELKSYPTNAIMPPPISSAVLAENQAFWNAFTKEILPSLTNLVQRGSDVRLIKAYYSRSLNHWGVELQKAKMLPEAAAAFSSAIALNPENAVALINQQYNASLSKGENRGMESEESLAATLRQYRDLQSAMTWNGPFDEPTINLQLGENFARGGNLRQSAQNFLRLLELVPGDFAARLGLAKTYVELRRPEEALQLVKQLQKEPKSSLINTNMEFELLRVESLAHLAKNDVQTAEQILLASSAQNPGSENQFALLTQFYLDMGRFTNALDSVQKQLAIAPRNTRAIFTKGVLQMQLGQFAQAVATFNELLKIEPQHPTALFNRAIANLQSGQLADAKRDYETLLDTAPVETFQIYYGLAQIAEKQNDQSAALKNYRNYSKYAPQGTKEFEEVQKRIKDLESGKG